MKLKTIFNCTVEGKGSEFQTRLSFRFPSHTSCHLIIITKYVEQFLLSLSSPVQTQVSLHVDCRDRDFIKCHFIHGCINENKTQNSKRESLSFLKKKFWEAAWKVQKKRLLNSCHAWEGEGRALQERRLAEALGSQVLNNSLKNHFPTL